MYLSNEFLLVFNICIIQIKINVQSVQSTKRQKKLVCTSSKSGLLNRMSGFKFILILIIMKGANRTLKFFSLQILR